MYWADKQEPILEKELHEKYWWKHKRIKVYWDQEPENPRELWEHVGTITAWHKRYSFDQDGRREFGEPEEFLQWLEENDAVYLPVYLLDHSGLRIATQSSVFRSVDPVGWDWGMLGWIWALPEEAMETFGFSDEESITGALKHEIQTLDDYYSGNAYYFIVEDREGNVLDSQFSIYGMTPEEIMEQAIKENV